MGWQLELRYVTGRITSYKGSELGQQRYIKYIANGCHQRNQLILLKKNGVNDEKC